MTAGRRLQGLRGTDDEIGLVGAQIVGERPLDEQANPAVLAQRAAQPVAIHAEGEQALQLMIAIRTARADMKGEVELGVSSFGEHGRLHSGVRPACLAPPQSTARRTVTGQSGGAASSRSR